MQILVTSDSHGDSASIQNLLRQYADTVTTAVFLGDCVDDFLRFQHLYSDINFVAVAGNCDFSTSVPKERILTLGGRRILLMHGHSHNVKMSYNRLMYYSMEKEVDACLFGHTHMPAMFSHESVFFMNPGSVAIPRMSRASYGLLHLGQDGTIKGELREI